jgi:hypothetical protein
MLQGIISGHKELNMLVCCLEVMKTSKILEEEII